MNEKIFFKKIEDKCSGKKNLLLQNMKKIDKGKKNMKT